jgi:natural product precursor
MHKKKVKKLTLSKESLRRLDSSDLRDIVGGASNQCTGTETCTDTCNTFACSKTVCIC